MLNLPLLMGLIDMDKKWFDNPDRYTVVKLDDVEYAHPFAAHAHHDCVGVMSTFVALTFVGTTMRTVYHSKTKRYFDWPVSRPVRVRKDKEVDFNGTLCEEAELPFF